MDIIAVCLIAVALAMDAMSIAISKGLAARRVNFADCLKLGVTFGVFQMVMPLLGWFVGSRFYSVVKNYSHWIAFALLAFIGIKMIVEAIKDNGNDDENAAITFRSLIILGIATSIDALAVGITFSMESTAFMTVLAECAIIGVITLIISAAGYLLGTKIGSRLGGKGEIIGGIILLIIGIKMVLDFYI